MPLLTAGALLYDFLKTDFTEVVYNISLISSVQQSDSAIHKLICTGFRIPFHYGLAYGIEYSFLCYTVGPLGLPILHNGL